MIKYVGKRLISSLLTIWVVITITFFLMRLMPGGPFDSEKLNGSYYRLLDLVDGKIILCQ